MTSTWMFIHNFSFTVNGGSVVLQSLRLLLDISYLELIVGHLLQICLIVLALERGQESILATTGCSQLVVISVKAI